MQAQIHAMKVNAINAARRYMRENGIEGEWSDHFTIESVGPRQFSVQHKQVINRDDAWQSLQVATEGVFEFPTAAAMADYGYGDKIEDDARRAAAQAFFNSRPAAKPLSEEEQAEFEQAQKSGDAEANNAEAVSDADYLRLHGKCPKCGSEETYLGYSEQIGNGLGKVIDDDRVGGCHACDFSFDERGAKRSKVWIRQSTVEKPVKRVWAIADEMIAANPSVTRKEVQAECVRRGIASGTARTQYQAWSTARKQSALNEALAAELSAKFNGK